MRVTGATGMGDVRPHERMFVSDPLDLISEGREKLAAEDRSGWSSAALSDRMLAVAAERERLEAEFVRLSAEWDARGAWGDDGFVSASAWLAANARMAKAAAGRLLRTARHVHRFEATADALADGVVTTEKVDALAESARHREELYERDEGLLLDAASRLDVRDLTVALRTWRNLADDQLASDDAAAAFARVHLDVVNGLLGCELAGFLDPEGAAILLRALDLAEPPDPTTGPGAPRSISRRRGEGLVKLARHYLDTRREVLDMGRAVRTPTAAQRRAVAVRDRHCQYPRCRVPAEWCDLHHVIEWERGGATDLAALVLLCRRHHHALHEGGRRLVRGPDGECRVVPGVRGAPGARRRRGETLAGAALPRAGPSG